MILAHFCKIQRILGFNKLSFILALFCISSIGRTDEIPELFKKEVHSNTYRDAKILGALLTDPSQVDEVASFSNAFAILSTPDILKVQTYLKLNANRMVPIIELRGPLFDSQLGVIRSDFLKITRAFINGIKRVHKAPVIFMFDELLWNIRYSCQAGKPLACQEVENRYKNTLHQIRRVIKLVRANMKGTGFFQVEAYAELNLQHEQWGQLVFLNDVEYLGFDCYGSFESCGGRSQREYIDWITETIQHLEQIRPMNRKIILVPGSFQDFNLSPNEERTVEQIQSFLDVFDSSPLFGGLGFFTWGTLSEFENVFLGTRTLPKVRPFVEKALRDRTKKRDSVKKLGPVLTLVGAELTSQGIFRSSVGALEVSMGSRPEIYLQSVGQDFCQIEMGVGGSVISAPANELFYATVPPIQNPLVVTATCNSVEGIVSTQAVTFYPK